MRALVIEARLPPEAGDIVLKALAAAGEALYARRRNDSAETFGNTNIERLNRGHDLDIDAETCVTFWDGTPMDHSLAVEALLYRDGALFLDPDTGHYPAHFPPVQQDG